MTERDQDDDSGDGMTGARRIDTDTPEDTDGDGGDDAEDGDETAPDDAVTADTGPDAELWNQRLESLQAELEDADSETERERYRERIEDLRSKMRQAGLLDDDGTDPSTVDSATDTGTADAPDDSRDADSDDDSTDSQASGEDAAESDAATAVDPGTPPESPDEVTESERGQSTSSEGTTDSGETADGETADPSTEESDEPAGTDTASGDEPATEAASDATDDEAVAESDPSELRGTVSELADQLDDLEQLFTEYKRKNERQHEILQKDAVEDLATRMLRVRETLLRAIEFNDWDESEADQLRGIVKQFDQQLTAKEIDPIDPDPGDEIDDLRHELAAPREDAEEVGPDRVLRVERKGFEVSGYPIRPAEIVATERDA